MDHYQTLCDCFIPNSDSLVVGPVDGTTSVVLIKMYSYDRSTGPTFLNRSRKIQNVLPVLPYICLLSTEPCRLACSCSPAFVFKNLPPIA